MVIGNGLIAKKFEVYQAQKQFLVFASGVSNSGNKEVAEFNREFLLLKNHIEKYPELRLVYFSTCSIWDHSMQESPYVLHKLKMERWIQENVKDFIIFRLSNPIGRTQNPHTVFNYFAQHLLNDRPFDIWKFASRNILDIDDMFLICEDILKKDLFLNQVVPVANITNYAVLDIVNTMEQYFDKKGNYQIVNKGNSPLIDTALIHPIIDRLGIDFSHNYIERILQKYF